MIPNEDTSPMPRPRYTRRTILRTAAAGVAAPLLASLAVACGNAASATKADSGNGTTASAGGTATTASTSGGVSLKFWMTQDNLLVPAMQSIINEFQTAHPTIKVQLEAFPFAEYFQKLSTAFAGGSAPDVFWMDVRTASFAQQGALLDLDQYVTKENRDDYLPVAWKEPTYQGKTYGVPLHELAGGLYINTKMAQDAGVELPKSFEQAWTWDQFVATATKLAQRSGDQVSVWGFGFQRDLGDWTVLPIIYQHGGKVLSDDLKKASGYLNSPVTVEALTWYGNLFTKEKLLPVQLIPDGFPNGKIAILQGPSSYRPVLDTTFKGFQYTIIPAFRDKVLAAMTGGWNVSIASSTKRRDEAWLLTDYVTREKHAEWVEKSGYLPARKSVIASTPKFNQYPWNIFMAELQQAGVTRPPSAQYSFFYDTFTQAVKDIATGRDPKTVADAAAQKLDAQLAK